MSLFSPFATGRAPSPLVMESRFELDLALAVLQYVFSDTVLSET
jgi:hypothetical protein